MFITPLEERIVLSIGTHHEMQCIAEGQPAPQYVWLKDNDLISKAGGFQVINSTR